MRKPLPILPQFINIPPVSVPLRGLDMRKQKIPITGTLGESFSPLAGIRYAETISDLLDLDKFIASFSPLAGIRYAET